MGIFTSTGTLTVGQSRTFNLSPASAVTLTLSPNVRVTITETPATVAATGLGGNASRVHEPRLPGVVTYGPYPMGGSVLVEVESNSGSSVGWVRSDSIVAESANGVQSLVDGAGKQVNIGYPALTSAAHYEASLLNHATQTYNFIGFDQIDGVVWVRDDTNGVLRQGTTNNAWSTTAGVTWSGSRARPTTPNAVLYTGIVKMLRFKASVYLLAKDSVSNITGVYRSPPIVGAGDFAWEATPVKQLASAGATGFYTVLNADADYLYLAEYGDPTGGPSAWRSADGTTWEQIYTEVGQGTPQRHIHAITPDPYNAGHLWMTMGDANAPREIMRSVDYGNTWTLVTANSRYQGVQISFTRSYVYIAGDSQQGIVMTIDRDTNVITWASSGLFKNLPVPKPTALTDEWYYNAWVGVVDPATGEYYCSANDTSAGGNTPGLFCVPTRGAPPVLIEKLAAASLPVDIAGGMLWFGKYRRPLHSI